MSFLILDSREGSGYADGRLTYEFPPQYLAKFESLDGLQPVTALIYEPRREGGRQAFVGWTTLEKRPVRQPNGRWLVEFAHPIRFFDRVVPFTVEGVPVEHRLRPYAPNERGRQLRGGAVRTISDENAEDILRAGVLAPELPLVETPGWGSVADAPVRGRRLLSVLERAAVFRDQVLEAYDFCCAITGLTGGRRPASRLFGCVDAAHIKPIAKRGPDHVVNGILLTPTVHRLFDAGLFSVKRRGKRLVVVRSPLLMDDMIRNDQTGTRIQLDEGQEVRLPEDSALQPSDDYLEFHRACLQR